MKQVKPYRTLQGAMKSLDNGGRFYNLWTKAGDEVVDAGELARVAGVFGADAQSFLFFEMALINLSEEQKTEVLARLSPDLRRRLQVNRARRLKPSLVEAEGRAGTPAIVSGYPVFVEDRAEFRYFVILVVPIITLIPIMDQFDVYEVYDTPEHRGPRTVVATARGSKRLSSARTRFAGVLKELQFEDKTGKGHGLYLETAYYTPLEAA